MNRYLIAILLYLTACSTPPPVPSADAQVIRVQASAAAQPWLLELYNCADELRVILSYFNDAQLADISLRLGEPDQLSSLAYVIDQDDLLVVSGSASHLNNLQSAEIQELFARPDKQSAQVWVFAPDSDIQQVFEREVMGTRMVTSLARLASGPQQIVDALNGNKTTVGILPRHWKTDTMQELFSISNVPLLAIVKSEPQGEIKALLACLQKSSAGPDSP